LDGIERKLNAKDLGYALEAEAYDHATGETTPRSLEEALDALESDHDYLTAPGAFTEPGIEDWIRAKQQEAAAVALHPHPHEYSLYYDL
jgi:glutamine synthetase